MTSATWLHKTKKACGSIGPHAFFICTFIGLQAAVSMAWADCPPSGQLQPAAVSRIVDGDTLWLIDGRKLRLIGINTPELGHRNHSPEPIAEQARKALQQMLVGEREIYLQLDEQIKDRYGRTLAYVYIDQGHSKKKISVQARLLEEGLAFPATIPPNTRYAGCFQRQADKARRSGLGVWAHDYFKPVPVSRLVDQHSGGYRRIIGRVARVSRSGSIWWIELEGTVSLRLENRNLGNFVPSRLDSLPGSTVEVSGWLVWRGNTKGKKDKYPPWIMSLPHPDAMFIK